MKIVRLTEGMIFCEIDGVEKSVDFNECYTNWIQYNERNRLVESLPLRTDRIIGQRDITANQVYIDFFTWPFTKIIFDDVDEYRDLIQELRKLNWNTIDLS